MIKNYIANSGPALLPPYGASKEDYFSFGRRFLLDTDCRDNSRVWTCLRGLSAQELKNATESVTVPDFWTDGLGALVEPFRPVSDRVISNLTNNESDEEVIFKMENSASAIFAGQTSEKPMLVGWNREDPLGWIAAIFPNGTEAEQAETVLTAAFGDNITAELLELFPLEEFGDNTLPLSRIFSEYIFDCGNRYMLQNQSNLWLYQMEAPAHLAFNETGFYGCDEGACHGVELYYLFGSFDRISHVFPDIPDDSPTEEALDLSREMQRVYLQYMKTGEMSWPKFNSSSELVARYQLGGITTETKLNSDVCEIFNKLENNQRYDRFIYEF